MSSSIAIDPATTIRTSLADQPRTHLTLWCEEIEAFSASLCREWGPEGALGLACTPRAWRAFPGNETTPADPATGTAAVYAARPTLTLPPQHANNTTQAVVSIYKEAMRKYQSFSRAKALISTAILGSIGLDNTTHLKNIHAPVPVYALDPQVMLTTMCARHGVLTKADLELLREPMNAPLTEIAKIEKHMSDFRLAAQALSDAGQGLTSFQLFESFLATISAFPAKGKP